MHTSDRFCRLFLGMLLFCSPFFSVGQSGPGGIGKTDGSSILRYWIDAGKSVTGTTPVTGWSDLSGYNITNTIIGSPSLVSSVLNAAPVVRFHGPGDQINTNLSINSSVFPNLTIIIVYTPATTNSGGVFGEDNGGWDRFMLDASGLPSLVSNGNGPTYNIPGIYPLGSPVITSIIYQQNVTNGTTVNANGTTESTITTTANSQTSNNFGVASIGDGNQGRDFNGDIAELMIFGTNLNSAQRIIIDNYLSAKYNIPLTTGSIYTQGNVANGGFYFDVAGIGRIDAADISADAKGPGMMEILNPSDLGDNEFLFWGHNGLTAQATNTTDVPAGVQARFARVWRVNERNTANTADVDVGNVDIRFDLTGLGSVTASDLRLLIDANNNGLFGDEVPISGATAIGGNQYQFTAVPGTNLTNNSRLTLATINSTTTPLPVTLLFFKAVMADNHSAILSWATASEDQSDYFELQRSPDATAWQSLKKVKAAGKSTGTTDYSTTDLLDGVTGAVYYRLKEVDRDGNSVYSLTQKLTPGGNRQLQVFPSPAQNIVYVQTSAPGEKLAGLFNSAGQNVLPGLRIDVVGNGFYSIDISSLTRGTYFLKTSAAAAKIIKN